jgi:hypothetical protein
MTGWCCPSAISRPITGVQSDDLECCLLRLRRRASVADLKVAGEGEPAVTFRYLIAPLAVAILAVGGFDALTQRAASAPPRAQMQASEPTSPTANSVPPERCMMRELGPLRWEVAQRRLLTRTAGQRHVLPAEACELIESLAKAEVSVIGYVEAHPTGCAIPQNTAEQMKAGHERTLALQKTVCTIAQQIERPGPGEPTPSDIVGRLARLPAGPLGDFGN